MLAAGQGRRFGGGKLLSPIDGESLLVRALTTAQKACPGKVCLVTGCESEAITQAASSRADLVVENANYRDGIGSSIATGVQACRADADAVVVMLADQPTVTAQQVAAVINTWSGAANEIVLSVHAGIQAPPTLFGSASFERLSALSGDSGARSVVESGQFVLNRVAFDAPAIDIDTQEDLQSAEDQVAARRNS